MRTPIAFKYLARCCGISSLGPYISRRFNSTSSQIINLPPFRAGAKPKGSNTTIPIIEKEKRNLGPEGHRPKACPCGRQILLLADSGPSFLVILLLSFVARIYFCCTTAKGDGLYTSTLGSCRQTESVTTWAIGYR
jgi:hypothetical protein